MPKRDHDTVSRASHLDDSQLRSPAQPQPYTSLYFNPITAYTSPPAAIPPPSSILLGNGPPSHLASSGAKAYDSTSTTPASSASDLSDAPQNMKEISPPPPRRSQARTESQVPIASNAGTCTGDQPHSFPMQMPQFAAPAARSSRASAVEKRWDKADMAKTLQEFLKGVRQDHSQLVAHAIEGLEPTEWRVRNGADLFQGLGTGAVAQKKGETMRIKFKQHLKSRKDAREEHYEFKAIKTTTKRVPRYRFHHVEIKKNVLTPNTMLTFVPHLRDLDSSEEPKYNLWLKELEQIDTESGFKPMNREEKVILTIQTERAATVSLYLNTWLEKLGIANCTKATLVAHMASRELSHKMTPQQKSDSIRSSREATDGHSASQDTRKAVALFIDAFKHVFDNDDLPLASRIDLRRSLLLEEAIDGVLDPKAAAKDAGTGMQGDVYKTTEAHVATFSILGCLICYSHSCDHGEYDKENLKQTFSLSAVMPLSDLLKQRRRKLGSESVVSSVMSQVRELRPWPEEDVRLLKSLFLGLDHAEDIAQDGFVIEYMGELITHDEGVRREARRGDVFNEESNISYVFTLLEHEGIWVDAATYGNLSRYINHATEHDRTGSNITPRILYVNGEFRIKFTALRDIQAGEELFFNYGENFPNLTKKLLDTKTGQKPVKPGRPPQSAASTGVARKAPKPEQKKMERKKPGAKRRRRRTIMKDNDDDDDDDDDDDVQSAYIPALNRAVKRKRGLERSSSDEDMYHTRGSMAQRQWQESAAEDEDCLVEEATSNGGSRTRRILRTRASETPTKVDKVKAAGRRGGARPGSGRPRKHPRPVPKLVPETAEPAGRLKDLSTKSTWRDSLSESPRTMSEGRAEEDEYDEVGDSQEWSTAGEDDATKAYRQNLRGGEEEEEEEEEEDDQDVVVRKRMDRATRNRRPPAKFRGDDF
ncbi:hypothetical protein MY1884_006164 [Beauveria asiatica]